MITCLQMEKCGKSKQWYFYVQMEGSETECERFECRVSVCKYANSERHSIAYNGKVSRSPRSIKVCAS